MTIPLTNSTMTCAVDGYVVYSMVSELSLKQIVYNIKMKRAQSYKNCVYCITQFTVRARSVYAQHDVTSFDDCINLFTFFEPQALSRSLGDD